MAFGYFSDTKYPSLIYELVGTLAAAGIHAVRAAVVRLRVSAPFCRGSMGTRLERLGALEGRALGPAQLVRRAPRHHYARHSRDSLPLRF